MASLGHLPIAHNGESDTFPVGIPKQTQGRKPREWVKEPVLEMPLGETCPHRILPMASVCICFALASERSLGSVTRLKSCGNRENHFQLSQCVHPVPRLVVGDQS